MSSTFREYELPSKEVEVLKEFESIMQKSFDIRVENGHVTTIRATNNNAETLPENIGDLTHLLAYLFAGGSDPNPVVCIGNVNGDYTVNIADLTYLVGYLEYGME